MELGKGFAFVARQQHIVTETDDYYIDLVFYNIELRCYVLIDLKMGKITHQDVGQIDMARQQHIVTETDDYYIDLVFYNIELRCYVLIDLKMGKITHQDVGQIDMYVRMYDDLKCKEGDNPTIGILLCAETDEDIARYSVLHDNNRLFMSKYLMYLPTKEQLKIEIDKQKNIFYMQHPELKEHSDAEN